MRSNPNTFLQLAESMFQFYVFVVLYCGNNWLLVHGQANCPANIYVQNNYFYILSDNQTDANNAQSTCSSAGGTLAEIRNNATRSDFIGYAVRKHISSDLVLVDILEHPLSRSSDFKPSWNNVFKFRPKNFSTRERPANNWSNWLRPREKRLKSIILYRTPSGRERFSTPVHFCWVEQRDSIQNTTCDPDENFWKPNFILFGGSRPSNETITLYNYNNLQHLRFSTSLFLNNDVNEAHLFQLDKFHYIPDISVFIGARSGVGQTEWFWNNGTRIIDENFPNINMSVCQQMTWPLTYDDGINLRGKVCDDEAYFLCQIKFEVQVDQVECDGSLLQATWNRPNLQQITNETLRLNVHFTLIRNKEATVTYIIPSNQASFTFNSLTQDTTYSIEASIQVEDCDQINISTSTTATTFYGIPGPVTNARVVNDSATLDCVIEWQYLDDYDPNILNYKLVTAALNQSSFEVEIENSTSGIFTQHGNTFRYNLLIFPPGNEFQFLIQVYTCEGASEAIEVEESCSRPREPSSDGVETSSFDIVYLIIPVVIVLLGLLRVAIIIFEKRKRSESHYVDATQVTQSGPTSNSIQQYENVNIPQQVEAPYLTTSVAVRPPNSAYANESVQAAAAGSTYANETPLNRDPTSAYENITNNIATRNDKHIYENA